MTDTSYVAQSYAGQMPILPDKEAQAQKRLGIIREHELQGLQRRKGSAKTDTGSNVSVGLSLAAQAKEANQRAILLKKEFANAEDLKPGYAAAMGRFNRLQTNAGVFDIALRGSGGKQLYHSYSLVHNNRIDPKHKSAGEALLDAIASADSNLMNKSVLASLEKALATLSGHNPQLNAEVDSLVTRTQALQAAIFAPSAKMLARVDNLNHGLDTGCYKYTVQASADPVVFAATPDDIAIGKLKDNLGAILKESYTLAKKAMVLNASAVNRLEFSAATRQLETTVTSILTTSDQLLKAEYNKL